MYNLFLKKKINYTILIKENNASLIFFKKQYSKKTVYTYICTKKLEVLFLACSSNIPNFKI